MLRDPRWYSALNVIAHYGADFEPKSAPNKANEMWATAVMLAGIQEVENSQYWMQPVSDREGSPDVRTIKQIPRSDDRAPDYVIQDVEVVTYTSASFAEKLPNFLLRTKLAPNKAYDELTTILIWAKDAVYCPPASEWNATLAGVGSRVPVVLIGQAHTTDPIYSLIQVHPVRRTVVTFNLTDTLLKQGYTGVINLGRGSKNKNVRREGEEHCPFESLGVICRGLGEQRTDSN